MYSNSISIKIDEIYTFSFKVWVSLHKFPNCLHFCVCDDDDDDDDTYHLCFIVWKRLKMKRFDQQQQIIRHIDMILSAEWLSALVWIKNICM